MPDHPSTAEYPIEFLETIGVAVGGMGSLVVGGVTRHSPSEGRGTARDGRVRADPRRSRSTVVPRPAGAAVSWSPSTTRSYPSAQVVELSPPDGVVLAAVPIPRPHNHEGRDDREDDEGWSVMEDAVQSSGFRS